MNIEICQDVINLHPESHPQRMHRKKPSPPLYYINKKKTPNRCCFSL